MDKREIAPGAFLRTLDWKTRPMRNGAYLDREIITFPPKISKEGWLNIHGGTNFGEMNEWLEDWIQQVSGT